MIVGHGIDIVNLNRFNNIKNKKLCRLANHILNKMEYEQFSVAKNQRKTLAKFWAIKEAAFKALPNELQIKTMLNEITVLFQNNTRPMVFLNKFMNFNYSYFVSISHDGKYVIASCVLVDQNNNL